MASSEDNKKDRVIGKIMDLFFDGNTEISPELHDEMMLWLLDEKDAELKDKHMMRKFEEIMGSKE